MSEVLAAALDYAARGWPVFPLRSATKRPQTHKGLHDATCDPDTLRYWFTRWAPDANVAVRTGAESGLVVVDLDCKNGVDGFASWMALLDDLDVTYERTREVVTPSGGFHWYYRHPGREIRNRAGVAPGVDVRGDGGYIVSPPSFVIDTEHGAFGRYELTDPQVDEPAELPAPLVEILAPPPRPELGPFERLEAMLRMPAGAGRDAYARAAVEGEVRHVLGTVPGERNSELFKSAAALASLPDLSDAVIADALSSAARSVGLGDDEIRRTIASGINRGRQNPRVGT